MFSDNIFLDSTSLIISYTLAIRDAKKKKLNTDHINNIFFYGTIIGILGARLLYIIETSNYNSFFKIWDGGLSSFGAITAVLIFIYLYMKKQDLDTWRYLDNLAPYIALALAIGRIGCLMRGCCHGIPTDLPWGILIGEQLVHPTQLYAIIYNFGIFLFLNLYKYKKAFNGQLILLFFILYPIFRFLNEIVRTNDKFLALSLPQYLSIITLGLAIYLYKKRMN